MSPTTTRVALRRAGTLLVAAALVGGPVSVAFADPSGEPTPSATASAPAESPAPTTSAEPSETASASPSPSASEEASPTPGPSAGPVPTKAAAKPAAKSALSALAASPETDAAAAFIARTLDEFGEHYVYPDSSGDLAPGNYPDHGNTIDAMIALAASGTNLPQAQQSLAWLESTIGSYVGTDWGDTYVGGSAKSLIGVVALGGDPTDVGGTDLVETLRGLETSSGRFSDTGSGDYSITITQALAVIALAKAGEPVTTRSVDVLLDQQCSDGGFRSSLGGSTCTSDPDATAFAAQALLAADDATLCWADVEGTRSAAAAGADDALDYLAGRQNGSGGVTNDGGAANANTTGVAGQAFIAGGRTTEAAAAASFIEGLQYDGSAPTALQGAIAFSAADVTTGTAPRDQDIRATPQATLLLAGGSLAGTFAPDVEAPAAAEGCPAEPTSTSEPTSTGEPTSTVEPTSNEGEGPTSGSDGGETVSPVASGPDALAQTGSDLLWPVGAGLLLVAAGALTVAASRRRGAHA